MKIDLKTLRTFIAAGIVVLIIGSIFYCLTSGLKIQTDFCEDYGFGNFEWFGNNLIRCYGHGIDYEHERALITKEQYFTKEEFYEWKNERHN